VKTCPKCERTLPESEYGVRTNGKPQHWCRPCHCAYQREYYERHKDYYFTLQEERVKRHRQLLRSAKSLPCVDCGLIYPPYVMDFDHRPGVKKCFNVSAIAVSARLSWKKVLAEIGKCDVVCANCHRERTHQRRQLARQAKNIAEGT